jgi:hypothetical protein
MDLRDTIQESQQSSRGLEKLNQHSFISKEYRRRRQYYDQGTGWTTECSWLNIRQKQAIFVLSKVSSPAMRLT